jgi:predicted ester cyclase
MTVTPIHERYKQAVTRLVNEVINQGNLAVADELFSPALAAEARNWVAPFRHSFPDVHMRIVSLVAEGDQVVGRFACSATHTGQWMEHPPTGRRFEDVDEVYFFTFRDDKIVASWGLEDTAGRLQQLGLR